MQLRILFYSLLFANTCIAQSDSSRKWISINRNLYIIDFPSDMVLDTTMEMGSDLFMNTYQDNPADSFSENITVLIQNLDEEDEGITVGLYAERQKDFLDDMYMDFKIEEFAILKNLNGEFHKWVYNGTSYEKHFKFEQYTFIAHKKVFIVGLTTTPETFERYKEVGERILNSFKLKL